MSTQMVSQKVFTAGEVDVVNWKRTDLDAYMTAAQSLLNMEVATTGLAKKRKGTKYLYDMTQYTNGNARGYSFQDKLGNYYVVIATQLAFNIFSINASTGNLTFYQAVSTPYMSADIPVLDWSQDNDVIVFAHQTYPPARLYISDYLPIPFFSYQVLNIYPLPAYDFNNINYNNFNVTVSEASNVLTFRFTGLSSNPGFNSAWIGGQIQGFGVSVTSPIGYAIITNVSYSGGVTEFKARIVIPFLITGAPSTGASYFISQPVFTKALGYPGTTLFYQNRLWFGGTPSLNNTVFGSRIGQPVSFDVGTGIDSDAIIFTIGQSDTGGIVALNGGKQLEIYTINYEFAAPQEIDTGITPGTFSIRQQSAFGSSSLIKPATYINDSYFVNKTGTSIQNFHFNGIGQTYVSSNVSVASSHLVKNPINRALQRGSASSQDNFIYYLNNDNTITAFQFATETGLAALTPITFEPGIGVIDIFTINNEVYMLKTYDSLGVLLIDSYNNEIIDSDGFIIGTSMQLIGLEKFVPDVKMDSYQISTMDTAGLIQNLGEFVGFSPAIVLLGASGSQQQLAVLEDPVYGFAIRPDGTIMADNPLALSGVVQVGLIYDVQLTPMYIYGGHVTYKSAGGKYMSNFHKSVIRVYVNYYNSLNFFVDNTFVPYQNYADVQQGLGPYPQTGTAIINMVSGYNIDYTFNITQSSPFDLQITGIDYQVESTII